MQIGAASQNLASTIALAGTNTALTGAAAVAQAPLSSFTTVIPVTTPITINHQAQFPVVTLSFNLAPGASLGAAVDHIRQATKEVGYAGKHRAYFPRHGAGVRVFAGQ